MCAMFLLSRDRILTASLDDRILSKHMPVCHHTVSRISVCLTLPPPVVGRWLSLTIITAVNHHHDINVIQRQTLHLSTHLPIIKSATSKLAYLSTFICMQ